VPLNDEDVLNIEGRILGDLFGTKSNNKPFNSSGASGSS